MLDREKVIKGLESCVISMTKCFFNRNEVCPYASADVCHCEQELMRDALTLLKELDAVKAEEAEMYILHNDGTAEYVKDIDSIMLLASKDYGITYCGTFAEGR